jgi:hypothetical protein
MLVATNEVHDSPQLQAISWLRRRGEEMEKGCSKYGALSRACFLENAISDRNMRKTLANGTPGKVRDDEAKRINSWITTIQSYMFSVFETSTEI